MRIEKSASVESSRFSQSLVLLNFVVFLTALEGYLELPAWGRGSQTQSAPTQALTYGQQQYQTHLNGLADRQYLANGTLIEQLGKVHEGPGIHNMFIIQDEVGVRYNISHLPNDPNMKRVLVPVLNHATDPHGGHYNLVDIDLRNHTITIHDSAIGAGDAKMNKAFLEAVKERFPAPPGKSWTSGYNRSLVQQTNGYDCGLHTILNAKAINEGQPLPGKGGRSEQSVYEYRKKLRNEYQASYDVETQKAHSSRPKGRSSVVIDEPSPPKSASATNTKKAVIDLDEPSPPKSASATNTKKAVIDLDEPSPPKSASATNTKKAVIDLDEPSPPKSASATNTKKAVIDLDEPSPPKSASATNTKKNVIDLDETSASSSSRSVSNKRIDSDNPVSSNQRSGKSALKQAQSPASENHVSRAPKKKVGFADNIEARAYNSKSAPTHVAEGRSVKVKSVHANPPAPLQRYQKIEANPVLKASGSLDRIKIEQADLRAKNLVEKSDFAEALNNKKVAAKDQEKLLRRLDSRQKLNEHALESKRIETEHKLNMIEAQETKGKLASHEIEQRLNAIENQKNSAIAEHQKRGGLIQSEYDKNLRNFNQADNKIYNDARGDVQNKEILRQKQELLEQKSRLEKEASNSNLNTNELDLEDSAKEYEDFRAKEAAAAAEHERFNRLSPDQKLSETHKKLENLKTKHQIETASFKDMPENSKVRLGLEQQLEVKDLEGKIIQLEHDQKVAALDRQRQGMGEFSYQDRLKSLDQEKARQMKIHELERGRLADAHFDHLEKNYTKGKDQAYQLMKEGRYQNEIKSDPNYGKSIQNSEGKTGTLHSNVDTAKVSEPVKAGDSWIQKSKADLENASKDLNASDKVKSAADGESKVSRKSIANAPESTSLEGAQSAGAKDSSHAVSSSGENSSHGRSNTSESGKSDTPTSSKKVKKAKTLDSLMSEFGESKSSDGIKKTKSSELRSTSDSGIGAKKTESLDDLLKEFGESKSSDGIKKPTGGAPLDSMSTDIEPGLSHSEPLDPPSRSDETPRLAKEHSPKTGKSDDFTTSMKDDFKPAVKDDLKSPIKDDLKPPPTGEKKAGLSDHANYCLAAAMTGVSMGMRAYNLFHTLKKTKRNSCRSVNQLWKDWENQHGPKSIEAYSKLNPNPSSSDSAATENNMNSSTDSSNPSGNGGSLTKKSISAALEGMSQCGSSSAECAGISSESLQKSVPPIQAAILAATGGIGPLTSHLGISIPDFYRTARDLGPSAALMSVLPPQAQEQGQAFASIADEAMKEAQVLAPILEEIGATSPVSIISESLPSQISKNSSSLKKEEEGDLVISNLPVISPSSKIKVSYSSTQVPNIFHQGTGMNIFQIVSERINRCSSRLLNLKK